ncbi:MAG TPA: hypothetical protein VIN60_07120 [Anaerolineales bacterium]
MQNSKPFKPSALPHKRHHAGIRLFGGPHGADSFDFIIRQFNDRLDDQKALKDAGLLTPEYLEFLAIPKWDGHLPPVIAGGAPPFIDLSQFINSTGK